MEPRAYWNSYVERCGGIQATADRLKAPYSTIACVCNGARGIGRKLSRRFAEVDPELDENILVWVAPKTKGEAAA